MTAAFRGSPDAAIATTGRPEGRFLPTFLISKACFTLFLNGNVSLHFGLVFDHQFLLVQLGLMTHSLCFSSGPEEAVLLGL